MLAYHVLNGIENSVLLKHIILVYLLREVSAWEWQNVLILKVLFDVVIYARLMKERTFG